MGAEDSGGWDERFKFSPLITGEGQLVLYEWVQ